MITYDSSTFRLVCTIPFFPRFIQDEVQENVEPSQITWNGTVPLKFDEEEFIHVLLIVYHERGREARGEGG